MTKELQDLVWSVLPKEFKEEVKRVANIYNRHTSGMLGGERALANRYLNEFIKLFGHDNLASDAEGEEMLTVSCKQIDALQGEILKAIMDAHDADDWQDAAHYILDVMPRSFAALFGSKCLPDETRDKREKRGIKRELNEDNFAKSEPKPAEAATPATSATPANSDRLHIAAQILTGLYANELCTEHRYMEELVEIALKATDLLIAESEKGGKDA